MGGKSTFLRQNALIVLMAQCGSFVPASRCSFSPIDAIFTRVQLLILFFTLNSNFHMLRLVLQMIYQGTSQLS